MNNIRVSVRALIVHKNKLLCVKLKKTPGLESSEVHNFWCTPGGGVEHGEPLLTALAREMIEELGISPKIGNLIYVQQFEANDKNQLEFFFHITNIEDYLGIDLNKTTHGNIEIAEVDYIDPKNNLILPEFLTKVNLEKDIEAGITKIFNKL